MHPSPAWLNVLQPFVTTLVLWPVVCSLISWLGGWGDLGHVYEDHGEFLGTRFRMRSATMNYGFGYGHCIGFSADTEGLRMRILPPFRFGHPPLFMPWADLTVTSRKSWFVTRSVFTFARVADVKISITKSLADELLALGRGKYNARWD